MKLKVVLLAGGYATRLWPLTKDKPKALLEVGEKTILEHVLNQLDCIPQVEVIYLTTNEKFAPNFHNFLLKWKMRCKKRVEMLVEEGTSESSKKGAVGALLHMHNKGLLNGRTLIMASDNLFGPGITKLLEEIAANEKENAIVLVDVKDREVAKHYGVCAVNRQGVVTDFEEKPAKPKSTLTSTGCYVLNKELLELLPEYAQAGGGLDRVGDFIGWLVKRARLKGHVYKGKWFDIGTHEQLQRARKEHSA
ncbi:UTP--glucose-1-phosphate uridylyltransferase AglF [Candidatus Burarchaeum australiense]|nr:UTP--glucose-1-phosphate uridylyltransferase AglF [Candidatus Burarchaeum australiense]